MLKISNLGYLGEGLRPLNGGRREVEVGGVWGDLMT